MTAYPALQARSPLFRTLMTATIATCLMQAIPGAHADRPHGWLPDAHGSAYTLNAGEISLSGELLRVNDTIDVFSLREDILSDNPRLQGQSGYLQGRRAGISAGLTSWLTAFYHHSEQDLTLEQAEDARVTLQNVDSTLRTARHELGLKWNLYEAGYAGPDTPWTAASLELTRHESESRDFGADIASIRLDANTMVGFNPPRRFAVDRMEDEGWQARLLLDTRLGRDAGLSLWAGYGQFDSRSGTGSEIQSSFIRPALEQQFDAEENQWLAGAGLHWRITPRLPLHIAYEYIKVTDRKLTVERQASNLPLPSALRPDGLASAAENNHVLRGSVGWWMTPRLRASIKGYLYTNQFTGVMPHFNNPLSGRLSSTAYGYAGIELNYVLGLFAD